MNNKIIGAVVLVVVVAAGAYFLMGNADKDASQQDTGEPRQQAGSVSGNQDEPQTQKASLKDLFARGSQTCTYSVPTPDGQGSSEGKVYTDNGKVRMDITSKSSASPQGMVMHSIVDGDTYYTWIDGESGYAFKMKFDPATGPASSPDGTSQGSDWNQQYDYDCDSGSVDKSKFDLPAGIEFIDFSAMMNLEMNGQAPKMPAGN